MCSGSSECRAIVPRLDEDTLRLLLADTRHGSTDERRLQSLPSNTRGLLFSSSYHHLQISTVPIIIWTWVHCYNSIHFNIKIAKSRTHWALKARLRGCFHLRKTNAIKNVNVNSESEVAVMQALARITVATWQTLTWSREIRSNDVVKI